MGWFVAFLVDSALAALNIGLFVWVGHWWSLASAVFCGLLAIGSLAMAVRKW